MMNPSPWRLSGDIVNVVEVWNLRHTVRRVSGCNAYASVILMWCYLTLR